jgi:hypothetical protein
MLLRCRRGARSYNTLSWLEYVLAPKLIMKTEMAIVVGADFETPKDQNVN